MNNLKIVSLTKNSLEKAVLENKYWSGSYEPPFSLNKAKWMLKNTRADEEDVLAVLCYEGYGIVAFVSLVPDLINTKDGLKKIFWSQRWWVSDKYKETVLSTYVKNMSLNECDNQVIIKFLGDKSKAYYEKQSFTKFSKRERYIILFSLDYELLIYKKNSFKKIASILKLIDGFSRRIVAVINKRKSRKKSKDINYERVQLIDDDTWRFIEKNCSNDIVPKSKEYINWQITNNQYHVIDDNANKLEYKCLLGTISKKIYNLNIVVKHNNEIVGFISGFVSRNRFIVRYFITTETYYNDSVNIMIKNLISSKCTILQTENNKLGEHVIGNYFKVYADVKELISLIHDDVTVNFENSIMTDQDGNFF